MAWCRAERSGCDRYQILKKSKIKDKKIEGIVLVWEEIMRVRSLFYGLCLKQKIGALSTWRRESDYVVQYNFYDASQARIRGEVV